MEGQKGIIGLVSALAVVFVSTAALAGPRPIIVRPRLRPRLVRPPRKVVVVKPKPAPVVVVSPKYYPRPVRVIVAANPAVKYVANTDTEIFHRPGCPLLKDVDADDLRGFVTRKGALDHGHEPCSACNP